MPVQRPAASGPARRWVITQKFELLSPNEKPANIRKTSESVPEATTLPARKMPTPAAPDATKVLRTRAGVPPAATQRSASQPQMLAEMAESRKTLPPIFAISPIE